MKCDLNTAIGFIVSRHPKLKRWKRATLRHWIGYHAEQGFVLPVSADGSKIAGIIIVRPIMNAAQAIDGYSFDHEGSILYVAAIIADSLDAFRALAVSVHHRFGIRPQIAWTHKRTRKLVIHSTKTVARRVFSYGIKPAKSSQSA